ncbi:MAG: DUF4663 domain-containing protein [Treponema sp.]|nr:DUF4663 domain-containing protein [Treponema sp.]
MSDTPRWEAASLTLDVRHISLSSRLPDFRCQTYPARLQMSDTPVEKPPPRLQMSDTLLGFRCQTRPLSSRLTAFRCRTYLCLCVIFIFPIPKNSIIIAL